MSPSRLFSICRVADHFYIRQEKIPGPEGCRYSVYKTWLDAALRRNEVEDHRYLQGELRLMYYGLHMPDQDDNL